MPQQIFMTRNDVIYFLSPINNLI